MRSLWNMLLKPNASPNDEALFSEALLDFFFAMLTCFFVYEVQNYKLFLRFHHKMVVFLLFLHLFSYLCTPNDENDI